MFHRSRLAQLSAAGLVGLARGAAAAEPPCEPAVAGPHVAQQSAEIRAAVQALLDETTRPGQPWSCRGGTVDAAALADGRTAVTIHLRGASRGVTREILAVNDLIPLGEALLALPDVEDAAPVPAPAEKTKVAPPAPPAAPTTPARPSTEPVRGPSLLLDASLDVRYAAPSALLLAGPRIAGMAPFGTDGTWVAGLWGRGGAELASFERGPGLGEVAFGASFGARPLRAPVELRGAVTAGAALVFRDLPRPASEETAWAPRLGLRAEAALPLADRFRLVGGADVEIAPNHFDQPEAPDDRRPYPAISTGVSVGLELALP